MGCMGCLIQLMFWPITFVFKMLALMFNPAVWTALFRFFVLLVKGFVICVKYFILLPLGIIIALIVLGINAISNIIIGKRSMRDFSVSTFSGLHIPFRTLGGAATMHPRPQPGCITKPCECCDTINNISKCGECVSCGAPLVE